MTLKLTILGCGTSGGVPRVGNIWGACDPANPKNRRRRCSVLVQREGAEGTTNVLVDTRQISASSCSTPASGGSTACSTPTTMPTTPTASMICAWCPLTGAAASPSITTS